MYEEDPKYGVIVAFNVNILPSAEEELNGQDIQVFQDSVIYQLTEDYMEWVTTAKERQKKERLQSIVRPSSIRIIPKLVFRNSKPAIAGVEIMSGIIEKGATLINDKGMYVGRVESMEDNGESLPKAARGSKVAMAIADATFEKDFEEGDVLIINGNVPRYKGDKMLDDELLTLDELKEIKQQSEDPNWGVVNTDWSELDTLDEDEYEDFY